MLIYVGGSGFPELIHVLVVNNVQIKRRKRAKTIRVLKMTFLIPKVLTRHSIGR